MNLPVGILLAILLIAVVWTAIGRKRAFEGRCATLMAALSTDGDTGRPKFATPPELVRKFAERSLPAADAIPRKVRLEQRCEMRFKPEGHWKSFSAEQVLAVRRPGFVWRARAELVPKVAAHVVDAWVDGRGLLEVRLLGVFPVSRFHGPEADRAELMRYLAELPWNPHALVANPSLGWREIKPGVVEVSAGSGAGRVAVRLIFEAGDIARVEADARPRAEGKRMVERPWSGRFWDYREINGVRVPALGEVCWELDTGSFAYWRGEIVDWATE